jgi:hypothetical protein
MTPRPKTAPASDPGPSKPDIRVENHFSLFLLWPLSERAEIWIQENVSEDRQRFGDALVVEPRHVSALTNGMVADGLTVVGEPRARQ